jgi:hypothetical protein
MNPRQFLLLGGIILVAFAVLGVFGLGPTEADSALGVNLWFDNGENVAHLVLGAVALLAYYFLKDAQLTRWLVILVGVIALGAALVGFLNLGGDTPGANFFGLANVENPVENTVHLLVGVWAFYVAFMGNKKPAPTAAA